MIRVAAAAQLICDRSTVDLPTKHIVDGCLVHDLGNLLKSDLVTAAVNSFKEFYEPEGITYWQQVKDEMVERYGADEDVAAQLMVADLKLHPESLLYFDAFGLEETDRIYTSGTLGEKIASYCDMRVGPHAILPMKDRVQDVRDRYLDQGDSASAHAEAINQRERMLEEIEREIFSYADLTPTDITDTTTAETQRTLWSWELTCV